MSFESDVAADGDWESTDVNVTASMDDFETIASLIADEGVKGSSHSMMMA